ncbi:MAG: hypothetical protein B7Z73_00750 [Planctomycetia bacterium 21-64-5]|nr:MAG: hypothetical protein B7Z73_00750 [Planctomycetia bacterium 21-64-5]
MGPLGTGVLYVRPGVEERVDSFRQGGTGTRSEEDVQPDGLPDKYEAGNLNVPGIVGLGAGIEWLLGQGVERLRSQTVAHTELLLARLTAVPGATIYGPESAGERVGLVSFSVAGIEPQELAAILDSAYGIQVRAGLHCAPLMHAALGTLEQGGTARLSFGPFNTPDEIERAADAIGEIASVAKAGEREYTASGDM